MTDDAATDWEALEASYRRWLAWYPAVFRHEHGTEMLGVLLEGARTGQRRPRPADVLDLLRGAVWMRLRPDVPRSARAVRHALRLMVLGALVELVALATILGTAAAVHVRVLAAYPHLSAAQWHGIYVTGLVVPAAEAGVASLAWLWLAWANGRGHDWARFVFAAFVGLMTLGLVVSLADGAAEFSPADLAVGGVLWAIGLGSVVSLYRRESAPVFVDGQTSEVAREAEAWLGHN